ncbi:ABC transporter permease [Kribbella solani]|uniref:Peptide/nickel transport system permease protein n=1 Tax=Kribbella solani TaxID=236067 RepID=A0A841E449_9ACTN|nr:ABC transporter permease [Kribbella solani]MBB5983720.1 peptide/nickel transport system permease protein [Kribbella solani]
MARYLVRRAVMLVVTLVVSSFVVFSGASLAPGNPLSALAGGRSLPPETIAVLEERYRLGDPFLVRYFAWVGDALHGNLGMSIALRQDVSSLIAARAGTTAELVLYATVIMIVVGVGLGLIAALRPGKVDSAVVVLTAVVVAVPPFVAAIVLIVFLSVGLGWFPAFGGGSGVLGTIHHLTLPAIALAAAATASVARITRTTVKDQLSREHVQTAISRGLPYGTVVRRHALRNALVPIVTLTGITTASMIALAAVVERAFSLNGLGAYLVEATLSKDLAVVQGICLVLVTTFVVVNTLVDVLAAALDPRINLGAGQ